MPRKRQRSGYRAFWERRDGAAAIEFAILALPFFLIVFASLETFIAFSAEQLLANANDTMARKIRTGALKAATKDDYRKAFCDEIAIMLPCSASELAKPDKLWLDVREAGSYSTIQTDVPMSGTDLDPKCCDFKPGGKKTINVVRAYYRWSSVTDLIRPYLSTVTAANGSKVYLMVATAVIENEDFP